MSFPQLTIYDPAMCCSTGVCGAEVDPALVRFAADLDWLTKQGASVRRYNLAQEPDAFAREELVRQALQQEGEGALPLIVMEGQVLSRGHYPTRDELASWARLGEGSREGESAAENASGCCGGGAPTSGSASGFCCC